MLSVSSLMFVEEVLFASLIQNAFIFCSSFAVFSTFLRNMLKVSTELLIDVGFYDRPEWLSLVLN